MFLLLEIKRTSRSFCHVLVHLLSSVLHLELQQYRKMKDLRMNWLEMCMLFLDNIQCLRK